MHILHSLALNVIIYFILYFFHILTHLLPPHIYIL
jgi:hypothetical protein